MKASARSPRLLCLLAGLLFVVSACYSIGPPSTGYGLVVDKKHEYVVRDGGKLQLVYLGKSGSDCLFQAKVRDRSGNTEISYYHVPEGQEQSYTFASGDVTMICEDGE